MNPEGSKSVCDFLNIKTIQHSIPYLHMIYNIIITDSIKSTSDTAWAYSKYLQAAKKVPKFPLSVSDVDITECTKKLSPVTLLLNI